ncbi:MAG TPA: hypothetical protein VHV26_15235 [Rhizomicrobium sp.]|nr:hypothetical protein [Rhizomicrobium sp.]
MRRTFGTVLRVIGCVLVAWAFTAGSYTFPITLFAAIGLMTLLNVLLFYELSIRDVDQTYALGAIIAIMALVLGGYGVWWLMQPPEPTGPLRPAGDPSPATACPEKAGPHDLAIYFATDRVIGHGTGPFTPFVVDHCPSLALQPKNGGLMVQAVAYDYGDNVAFTVRNNVYEPAELLQLRVLRPDKSTFVLLDRFDQEVIYVRYLNRNAVLVRARFLCGEAPQALIRNNGIFTGGVRIEGAYVGLKRAPGHRCAVVESGGHGIAIGDPS